ncbi:DNA (cytosine-5-)-methyltransferase [uncultured Elizabethkingia sp.]|uniref:DNA cytosine methyltransferase n=1 Tax=uncultured Elizabethkingia sp. TaxID=432638 RepID=UPI002595A924|nr:DNA (cytosine-5-)-methyltransferase [uncultured Elizabethkingia sp.]
MEVIDFFCGAGGFSQGFKQLGFKIIYGYDNWEPAVKTFNYNYNLNCIKKNILNFHNNIDEINRIPNTEIIIGSPPCVSFSSSNKSGKADKSLGIKLTETFLQIIAIKKFQPNSKLKAWYMENVANSYKYLRKQYTFKDLKLQNWAIENNINPNTIAIRIEDNYEILNSMDFGSFQNRKRFITGENVQLNRFIIPSQMKMSFKTLKDFKSEFISPFDYGDLTKLVKDPNYPFQYMLGDIADHFYDTGIHSNDVKFANFLKTNHPFMGKMSIPENEDKPSRTITATFISNSREAIIYETEIKRNNGKFRTPTTREASIIMGFPLNYQFYGKKSTKWRLVGNAVCVEVSRSLAKVTLESLNEQIPNCLNLDNRTSKIDDLNTYKINYKFKKVQKKPNVKFRWHILKDRNITITLTNFNPLLKNKIDLDNLHWYTSIQYGTGEGFPNEIVSDYKYEKAEYILKEHKKTKKFIQYFESKILNKIGSSFENQKMFSLQKNLNGKLELSDLLVSLKDKINQLEISNELISLEEIFTKKSEVPLSQILCFYIINILTTKINNYGYSREN